VALSDLKLRASWNISCSECASASASISMNSHADQILEPIKSADLKSERQFERLTNLASVPRRRRGTLIPIVVVATAVVLGLGLWILSRRLAPEITSQVSPESAYVASFPERSIAVLPFEDLTESKENNLLAGAVQDAILTALAKVSDLRVISRTSVTGYPAGKPRDLSDIAQSLGAGHILEGSVNRIGEKVQITLQLTDARRNARLWNTTYERVLSDVFGMQSEIVQRIASQLQASISSKERAAIGERPTRDLAAYGLYVRGKTLVLSVSNAQIQEKLQQAVAALDQAVARDPGFYLAWCELAAAHDYLYFFGFDHTPNRLALAEAALNTVIRLRPEAGETHLARATFLYRCFLDYDRALAELALIQRELPNDSKAFELAGYVDRRQGLWAESARSLQRAVNLDPRNVFLLQQIAASYEESHQYGAMAAALDRALAIDPHDLDTRVTRAVVELEWRADTRPLRQTIATLLAEHPGSAGDFADQWLNASLSARDPAAVAQALAAIPPTGTSTDVNFPRAYCEALAARSLGDAVGAQEAFLAARAELEKTLNEQPDYGPVYTVLGLIDAGLGRKDEAMREGRRAVELLPITKNSIDGAELMKYLAVIYAWCGEKDLALQQIEATLRIPSTLNYGSLKLHPYWDALRGDPRFEKIVADLAPRN
jgi:TolB-like protein/Tfp pilus assembly protein PilF